MEFENAIHCLSALAQETRIGAVRYLVERGQDGAAAGEIADALKVPANTLSTHLSILAQSDIVTSNRDGRTVRYRIRLETLNSLIAFLMRDCCRLQETECACVVNALLKPAPSDRETIQ